MVLFYDSIGNSGDINRFDFLIHGRGVKGELRTGSQWNNSLLKVLHKVDGSPVTYNTVIPQTNSQIMLDTVHRNTIEIPGYAEYDRQRDLVKLSLPGAGAIDEERFRTTLMSRVIASDVTSTIYVGIFDDLSKISVAKTNLINMAITRLMRELLERDYDTGAFNGNLWLGNANSAFSRNVSTMHKDRFKGVGSAQIEDRIYVLINAIAETYKQE
jgi:hypothetical protein